MTDTVAVVEYGSHTFRAGLAYNFPSDQEPRLVGLPTLLDTLTELVGMLAFKAVCGQRPGNLLQVIPASVRAVPPNGTAEQSMSGAQQNGAPLSDGDLGQTPVVQNGRITYWPGFEALLHYILYQQAGTWQLCILCMHR